MKYLKLAVFLVVCCGLAEGMAATGATERTVVLPFRTIGVDDTTATVSRVMLQQELLERGLDVLSIRSLEYLPTGPEGCSDRECAATWGQELAVDKVVYGSLSRLGEKIIVQVLAIRVGEVHNFYSDRLTSTSTEDLDRVMLRVAEGIAAGRPNSDLVTIDSTIQAETDEPFRRSARRGLGIRAGLLYPLSDSYGGVNRLTNIRLVYKYEGRDFLIETTPLLGLTFGSGSAEWSLLDVFVAKIIGLGDFAGYIGGGLGLHSLHVTRRVQHPTDGYHYTDSASETTMTLDIGVGLLAMRTYDFNLTVDVRYHHVFTDPDKIGSDGARGLMLTFGTHW